MPIQLFEKDQILQLAAKNKVKTHIGWRNFTNNLHLPQAVVLDVQNQAFLQTLLKTINNFNQNKPPQERTLLRVAAGGKNEQYSESFSFTEGAEADVILHLLGPEFQMIEVLDKENKIVRVGASVQIGKLNKILYDRYKLSLPTASLIPYVTFAGLTANAGHGTGVNEPGVAGLIQAMTICRPDGKIVRIDANHPDFFTIRGAHLGVFGIVLNMEIACIDAKKLQCVMEARNIKEFEASIKKGLVQYNDYVSVMYIPTYRKDERTHRRKKNVIIRRFNFAPLDVENTASMPLLSQFSQALSIKLSRDLQVGNLLHTYPNLIPNYMKYLVSQVEVGVKDKITLAPLPQLAHYQTAYPRNIADGDYLFETMPDGDEIIQALEFVVDLLDQYAKRHQYPVIDAIYLRFLEGTNGGLSITQHKSGKIVCGFDIVSDPKIESYAAFRKEVEAFFFKTLHAKPHWGKSVPLDQDYASMYGESFTEFMQALRRWYADCNLPLEYSPFINRFFTHIFQLPCEPIDTHIKADAHQLAFHAEKVDPKAVAQQLLEHISAPPMETADASKLKNELEKIVNKNTKYFSNRSNMFFEPSMQSEKVDTKKPSCWRCTR